MAGAAATTPDQALMTEVPSKLASMLKVSGGASGGATGAAAPKIVEVGEDGTFDMERGAAPAEDPLVEEAEEDSLMDMMMADANANRAERKTKTDEDTARMKASFGDGMKKGLKKGFFDAKPPKKKKPPRKAGAAPPPPRKADDGPITIAARRADDAASVTSAIKKEVAARMASDTSPLAQALGNGEWVTPDLVREMAKRPALAAGMNDPRCTAALEEFKKDPTKAAAKFDSDPKMKAFLAEFCDVMGSHFEKMGAQHAAANEDAPPPAPTPDEAKAMGPLAAAVCEEASRGKGPAPAKTVEEKKEVSDVLNNQALCDLLMNPKTQELMQRCGDPRAFQLAMRDPAQRAIIKQLQDAGLVQMAA